MTYLNSGPELPGGLWVNGEKLEGVKAWKYDSNPRVPSMLSSDPLEVWGPDEWPLLVVQFEDGSVRGWQLMGAGENNPHDPEAHPDALYAMDFVKDTEGKVKPGVSAFLALNATEVRITRVWLPVRAQPAGTLFVTLDGIHAVKTQYRTADGRQAQCVLLSSGEYAHFPEGDDTLVKRVRLAE